MSDDLQVTCTGCGARLRVDRGFEGMVIRCSTCGEFMQIPVGAAADGGHIDTAALFGRPDSPTADEAAEDDLIVARQAGRSEQAFAYCPGCRRKLGLTPRELADGEARCPACGREFVLPIDLEAEAPLAPSERSGIFPAAGAASVAEKRTDTGEAHAHARKLLNSVGMTLVHLEPGQFLMGSPPDEEGRRDEETLHLVRLSRGFYLSATPVTQAQWREVMKSNPSAFKHPKLPVDRVSWLEAMEFCERLTQQERMGWLKARLRKQPPRHYRLPSEAQWEYACRAGSPLPFWFGRKISTDLANYDGRKTYAGSLPGKYRSRPNPINRFKPNPWGLVDMHGNVLEWCADWHGSYPVVQGALVDPTGPAEGFSRVVRGGGWHSAPADCRAARRHRYAPERRQNDLGFRVAMDLE